MSLFLEWLKIFFASVMYPTPERNSLHAFYFVISLYIIHHRNRCYLQRLVAFRLRQVESSHTPGRGAHVLLFSMHCNVWYYACCVIAVLGHCVCMQQASTATYRSLDARLSNLGSSRIHDQLWTKVFMNKE
jgi:hypothetical protein